LSLAVDIDNVTRVLMADGWHRVYRKSFSCQAGKDRGYVFPLPNSSIGMEWIEVQNGTEIRVCAPLSSLIAVEVDRP
jgi:hypothetical protein